MEEVKDIGNLEAMQLYAHIYRTLTEVSASWNVFKQLFLSGEDNIHLMNQAASGAFTTIQRSMYGYVILEIAKLVEPAWFGKHENLSILRMEELLQRTHAEDAKRISATWLQIAHELIPCGVFAISELLIQRASRLESFLARQHKSMTRSRL